MSGEKRTIINVDITIYDDAWPPAEVARNRIASLLFRRHPRKPIRERLKALQARVMAVYPELADGAEDELAAIQREWFQDAT